MRSNLQESRLSAPEDIPATMNLTDVYGEVDEEPVPISYAWLYLTLRCECRCRWCYVERSAMDSPDIPLELAHNIVTLLSDIGVEEINLIGGEPTLYSHFFELAHYIRSHNIDVSMSTNGWALARMDFAEKVKELDFAEMTVSIESNNPAIHDSITRVKGSFDKTMKAIKNCLQLDLDFKANVVISKSNKEGLLDLLNSLADMGVKNMDFDLCIPPFFQSTDEAVSPREYAQIFPQLYYEGMKRNVRVRFDNLGPLCLYDQDLYREMRESGVYRLKTCEIIKKDKIIIDNEGNILPCNQFSRLPVDTLIAEEGTTKIVSKEEFFRRWNSHRFTALRHEMSRLPSEKCKNCELYQECLGGGCPLLWTQFDPDVEIPGM